MRLPLFVSLRGDRPGWSRGDVVTAARMLNRLTADLRRRGVRLVLAGAIGQVRDMVAAVAENDELPENHRTVQEAVDAARTGASPGDPPGNRPPQSLAEED